MTATEKLDQRVGQMLKGRYRIDQALYCSAESTVYAGMDLKSGRAAIKVFEQLRDASLLSRSYLANAVGHPSTVNVLDSGSSEDGTVFVVMELLEATSMAELLSTHEGHLPVRMACNIADQALDLLASAHAQGIVHGALELRKLFYTRNEQLKVLGFGKLASGEGEGAAFAEDVQSLSRVIAQLLMGKPVDALLVADRASRSSQPLGVPVLPRRIAAVIQRGLTSDPAQRWQSASAMRTALQLACLAELGRPVDRRLIGRASKAGHAAKPKPARTRRGRAVWLAVACALVGSIFAVRELVQPSQAANQTTDVDAIAAPAGRAQADEPTPTTYANDTLHAPDSVAPSESTEDALPTRIVPRKPSIPALRARVKTEGTGPTLPSNIAPTSPLCAQLGAARRVRTLNEEEAQLWVARCVTP